jgi:hypothetical protein
MVFQSIRQSKSRSKDRLEGRACLCATAGRPRYRAFKEITGANRESRAILAGNQEAAEEGQDDARVRRWRKWLFGVGESYFKTTYYLPHRNIIH